MFRFFGLILKWPKTTLVVIGLLAFLGWHLTSQLAVDVFPDIAVPQIVIQTEAGGLSADEVERLVTMPIESSVNGLPGITAIRSSSGGGLSFVWIDFDVNTDLSRARFDVFERLSRISETLPEEVRAEIAPVVSVTGEIMIVALTAKEPLNDLELRELAEYDLRMRLLAIPGIGEVTVMGGQLPEYRIHADPHRLATYGLDVNDLVETTEAAYTFLSAGYLPSVAGQELPLRQIANLKHLDELKHAVIPSAVPLRLGDVAEITLSGAPRRGSGSFDGTEAVLLSIQKTPGGNTLELTERVEAVLEAFEHEFKASGLSIHREAYRQADLINASIAGSRTVLRDAVLVVLFVLGLTLLNLRTITVVLITMPLSVLLGLVLFPTLGIGINVMTLGGFAIAAGDIVDAAIIFTEVIWRRLREKEGQAPTLTIIAEAAYSVIPGVLSSTLAIILVFTPILLLSGLESRFFRPFALSYLAIFIASFAVSMVAVPALSKLLWRAKRSQTTTAAKRESIATRMMKACYRPFLCAAIKVPYLTLGIALALCLYTGWMARTFGSSFLPPFREDAFNAALTLPPGTSLEESERVAEGCCAALREIPGVLSVTRRTGRAERDQHAEPVSSSEFVVRADLNADTQAIRSAIRAILTAVPGASAQVGYPIAHRISAILSGTEAELAISLYHEDIHTLRATVARLKSVLEKTAGVTDVQANREVTMKTLRIDYHLEALAEAGLTLQSAGEQVAIAFNGIETGEMRDGIRRRPIVVRLANTDAIPDEDTVKQLLLHAPNGKYVQLQEVADIVPEEASNLLLRENGRRRALISCNVAANANIGDLVATLQKTLDPIAQEMGCSIAYGGSHTAREQASQRLITLSIVLLIALFALILFTLGNARTTFVSLISIPLGLMGGIVAVSCTNTVVSVPSLIGFVTVAGFTIRNGILLLKCYQEQLTEGATLEHAILHGSLERMVPIIMTSLTTVLGLFPIMIAADKPGGELLAPLAAVQFGGILSAMFLGLLVLPAAAKIALRTTAKPILPVTLLLASLTFLTPGCQSYTAKPIDWEAELQTWHHPQAPLCLTSCEEAAQLALIGNSAINLLRLQAAGSHNVAVEAGWWNDPSLDLDLSHILQSTENPFLAGAALNFTIPLSGALQFETRAAEGYAKADALDVHVAEQSLATETRIAFHAWQMAMVKVHLFKHHLESSAYHDAHAAAQQLTAVGELSYADLAEIKRAHTARLIELRTAEQAVLVATETLKQCMGLAPWVVLQLQAATPDAICPTCPQHLPSAQALTAHPKVLAQLMRLGADEDALHAEIQRQYPDLTLGPSFAREEGLNQVGVVLGIDLPLWNRNRQAIAAATASRNQTHYTTIQTWRTLVREAGALQLKATHLTEQAPPPLESEAAALETLFRKGELSPLDYLAALEGNLDLRLATYEWFRERLLTQAEYANYQTERKAHQ